MQQRTRNKRREDGKFLQACDASEFSHLLNSGSILITTPFTAVQQYSYKKSTAHQPTNQLSDNFSANILLHKFSCKNKLLKSKK